jgi:hypothetical protein
VTSPPLPNGDGCVAAEVAEEVGVFFEDRDRHAGTRQEQTQHHAGGTAASDRALDVHADIVPFTAL